MAQLSILDLIEKKLSVDLNIPESIIDIVIRHKWKSLHDATDQYQSAEDSGLGKFTTRPKKITRRLERLNQIIENSNKTLQKEDITELHRKRLQSVIERALVEKEYLETKI